MAKKESTAVNDLINLVAQQGPSVKDPGADLFSEPPKKSARMTATLPPVKGAGSVEPLPRTRAPAGTQQNAAVNPPVRVSTAMPRANSIPPMAGEGSGRVRPALPPPRASGSMARSPIPSSAKVAVPAVDELDVDIDSDDEADLLKTPVAQQPRAVAGLQSPPSGAAPMTLNEPVYPRAERTDHPNAAPDMTGASPWFEASNPMDRVPEASHSMTENTAQVGRAKGGTVDLIKKLALPMGVAIVLGVFVGGYIVFDGQGGKKRTAQAATATEQAAKTEDNVAPSVALPAVADEAKAVEPAKADEPVKTDEPKTEEPAKVAATEEPAKAEPAKTEEPKTEPTTVAAAVAPTKPAPANDSVLGGAVESLPATTTAPKTAKPVFVDVRIDSTPSGADVSLVDRGKTTFLGTTPISASVDPSRSYDVIFTYANKAPQVEHLDPKTTTRLAIKLGKSGNQSKEVAKPVPASAAVAKVEAPKAEKKAVTEVKPAKTAKVAEPFEDDTAALQRKLAEKKAAKTEPKDEPKAEKAVAKAVAKGGEGTLMISSKPPCEIFVDGKPTGLMTPQRAMSLPAGNHKITLVSPDKAHKKTVAVEISADKPTKVIQDLLK